MLACAMVLTQAWYPEQFVALKHLEPLESWAVVCRDLILLSMFCTLAFPEFAFGATLRSLGWSRTRPDYSTAGI